MITKRFLLTLYRQGGVLNNQSENDSDVTFENRENIFFSTDYFDKLTVEEIDAENEMAVFMGMAHKNHPASDVMAIQNYAIFQDVEDAQTGVFDCIFQNDEKIPYLGLIHVYITPDVWKNLSTEIENQDYIQYFERDLRWIVEKCNTLLGVTGMVFKTLSAGDFVIAIRSKNPEDIYSVAISVRKRVICKQSNSESSLSAYKTYTILTINGSGLDVESEPACIVGKIAIRGRYSNVYWKEQGKEEPICVLEKPDDYVNMNGRYDFLLHLDVPEFLKIYPLFCKVKGFKTEYKFELTDDTTAHYSAGFIYLCKLIENGYISYLNERYLMGEARDVYLMLEKKTSNPKCVKRLFLDEAYDTKEFMFDKIDKVCRKMMSQIEKLEKELKKGNQYKESIGGLLKLFTNLVQLCRNVNSLSDARIYVVSLLEQMKVVLESFQRWIDACEKDDTLELQEFTEQYLRRSIVSMEAYATIIRNNNLQTLQSPNYNAVMGISMEKILIGYSRFLSVVMSFCCDKLGYEVEKQYLPVMIPTLEQGTLSVEVMFPKWFENVYGNSKAGKKDTYLMVVAGPATQEIVNMAYIITILFHEMAHHLRYEHRQERNKVLLRMILEDVADALVHYLFAIVVESSTELKNTTELQVLVTNTLVDVLEEQLLPRLKSHMNYSLENFKDAVQNETQKYLELLLEKNQEIKIMLRGLLEDTNEYIKNDNETINALISMSKNLKKFMGECDVNQEDDKNDETEQIYKELLRGAPRELEKQIKGELFESIEKYVSICQTDLTDSEKKSLDNLQEALITNIDQYPFALGVEEKNVVNSFYDSFYKKLCEKWEEGLKDEKGILTKEKEWIKQGRKLGIDLEIEANKSTFRQYFEKAIKISEGYEFARALRRVSNYREETSDLFMCTLCQLDLRTYLVVWVGMYSASNNEIYDKGYLERLTDIILVQWCLSCERDIYLCDLQEKCYKYIAEQVGEHLCSGISSSEMTLEELIRLMKDLANSESLTNVKRKVANLSWQILLTIEERINWFKSRDYLLKDYFQGKKEYQKLRAQFQDSSDLVVQRIDEMCRISKEYLNSMEQPDYELQKCYQKKCEEFIIDNYYDDKIHYAREEV